MEVESKSLSHYLLCEIITEVAFGEGVFQFLHPALDDAIDAFSTLKVIWWLVVGLRSLKSV